jgi:small multidrug resistance pump
MAWVLLAVAIASEIVATLSLKQSEGFSRLGPSVVAILGYVISLTLVGQALKTIPVSVAYAIWSGAGTAIVAGVGMAFLGESVSVVRVAGISLIVVGVVVLNIGGAH